MFALVNSLAAAGFAQNDVAKMLSELKKFGANGHLYIPGVGAISGITAGNYLDSIGTTNASVDGNVGLVKDAANVSGINASQGTTGYQPKLRRGLVNYQLNSAPIGGQWVAEATGTGVVPAVTHNYATAPDGSSAARAILDKGAGATSADLSQFRAGNSTVISGAPYTSAIWLRTTVEGATAAVSLRDNVAASTLTVTDQWQLFVRSGNAISAIMSVGVRLRPSEATSSQADILVGAAGIFQGTLTAAQILAAGGIPVTATAPASSPAGAYKWELDGVDDSMSLGVVPFQISDDHCVIAMGNNLAAAGNRYIIDFGSSGSANPICGSVGFSNSAVIAQWRDDSGTANLLSGGNVPLGTQAVVTARKVGNSFSLRANGSQVAANSASLSTTTLTGAKLGVKVFGGNLYQGVISGIITIRGAVTDAQALIFERGLNALSQYAAGRF